MPSQHASGAPNCFDMMFSPGNNCLHRCCCPSPGLRAPPLLSPIFLGTSTQPTIQHSPFSCLCHFLLSLESFGIFTRNYTFTLLSPVGDCPWNYQGTFPTMQIESSRWALFGRVNSLAHCTRCSSSILNSILALNVLDCNYPFICLFLTMWHGLAQSLLNERSTLPSPTREQ